MLGDQLSVQNEKSLKTLNQHSTKFQVDIIYIVTIPKLQRQAAEASAYAAGRKRELNILDEDKLDKRYALREQSSIICTFLVQV